MSSSLLRKGLGLSRHGGVFRQIGKHKSYNSISAPPGEVCKERQDVSINPISSSSTVLVVGASRGIGLEFIHQLLKRGATVIATHRESAPPSALSGISCGGNLTFLRMDAGDADSVVEASQTLLKSSGRSLTHIIHNAGIISRQGLGEIDAQEMMDLFRVNAVGPALVAQHFSPLFRKALTEAAVPVLSILTSKVGSIDDNGGGGMYAYRSSKSAVNQVGKSLSIDLHEEGIKVVMLHPGYVSILLYYCSSFFSCLWRISLCLSIYYCLPACIL
jgi:NAD(P)-dependent dehydrogenase (short-subunit alcohol dehydrogenase family)